MDYNILLYYSLLAIISKLIFDNKIPVTIIAILF